MKVAVFAGAGFSAPFGLPVMGEFFGMAQDSNRLNDDEKIYLHALRSEARKAVSFLDSSPTNLEDILSFAVMGRRLNVGIESSSEPKLESIIRKIYTRVQNVDHYWESLDVLKGFLGISEAWNVKDELYFITTNYDVLLESALHRIGIGSHYGMTGNRPKEGPPATALISTGGALVAKLHGSVNWFVDSEDPKVVWIDDRVVRVRSAGGHAELPYVCAGDYATPLRPMLIPPSFLKPEFLGSMSEVWAQAAKALAEADHVVFVGYSFPSSDIEMKYFLARSLVDNMRLRTIEIIDPNATAIVKRLCDPASGFGGHFRAFLRPVDKDWTKAEIRKSQ